MRNFRTGRANVPSATLRTRAKFRAGTLPKTKERNADLRSPAKLRTAARVFESGRGQFLRLGSFAVGRLAHPGAKLPSAGFRVGGIRIGAFRVAKVRRLGKFRNAKWRTARANLRTIRGEASHKGAKVRRALRSFRFATCEASRGPSST